MALTVRPKDPDTAATYELVVLEALVREAARGFPFALDDLVLAPRDTGLYYVCTKAGRTAQNYPSWPRTAAKTVLDGTVEWTARDPADVTPPEISSVSWSLESGLTLDSQEQTAHVARVTVSGGVDGRDYDMTARITPTTGTPIDVTLLVPVRQQ